MNKTAGHMMGYMGLMDDDAKMLCKVLEISAAQALALKKKIKMGQKLPSWAEYKIYKAGDALKSALASTHSMRDHMPRISIAIKSTPPMGSVLPSNMSKMASPKAPLGVIAEARRGIIKRVRGARKELNDSRKLSDYENLRKTIQEQVNRRPIMTEKVFRGISKNDIGRLETFERQRRARLLGKTKKASPLQNMGSTLNRYKPAPPPEVTGAARKKPRMFKAPKVPKVPPMLRLTPMPMKTMKKEGMMGNSPFTQKMMGGSGLPGYSKGGPVKKDGYLTDKKGKPYARVHKGEKVVPKEEKTKKAWSKIASPTSTSTSKTPMMSTIKTPPPSKAATSPYHPGTKLTKRHYNSDGTMKGGWTNVRKNPLYNPIIPTGGPVLRKKGPDVARDEARAMEKGR